MLRLRALGYWAVLILLMSWVAGCFQADNHPQQEEADPHFQKGRELVDGQDFTGAAREFELALEDNPRSAAAHFELGWLYDTKLNDYAAAIYHYERHLLYKPDSKRAIMIEDRIRGCKEQLATAEFVLPSKDLQRQVERLNTENLALRKQLEDLTNQPPSPTAANNVSDGPAQPAQLAQPVHPGQPARRATTAPTVPTTSMHSRTHVVRAHETFTSIAAQYRIKTRALLAANPRVNPRRLRVGQTLYLP